MDNGQNDLVRVVSENLAMPSGDGAANLFFLISGIFGTGKTSFVRRIADTVVRNSDFDLILPLNAAHDIRFLPDMLCKIADQKIVPDKNKNLIFAETISNKENIDKIIPESKVKNFEFHELILDNLYLKSTPELRLFEPDKNHYENLAKENFPNDKRLPLLLQNGKICAESFIIDLITGFYPSIADPDDFEKPEKPLKILFIIDNSDEITGSLSEWLTEIFAGYYYSAKLRDFNFYDMSSAPAGLRVVDLFDFRFIVSSRERTLEEILSVKNIDIFKRRYSIDFAPFKKHDLKEIIEEMLPGKDFDLEMIYRLTRGIPYLVELWIDIQRVGGHENTNGDKSVFQQAADMIMKYLPEYQRDWLMSASFLGDFDLQDLKCMPLLKEFYAEAYNFFLNAPEYAEIIEGSDGRVQIIPEISHFIREALRFEASAAYRQLDKMAAIIHSGAQLLASYTAKEIEALFVISIFRSFDVNSAIKYIVPEKIDIINDLVTKKPDLFQRNKFTIALADRFRESVREYFKLYNSDYFNDLRSSVEEFWKRRRNEIREKIKLSEEELTGQIKTKRELEASLKTKAEDYENIRKQYLENEEVLIALRNRKNETLENTALKPILINISATLIVFLITYFADGFSGSAVGIILLIITGLLALNSGRFIKRRMDFNKELKNLDKTQSNITELNIDMNDMLEKMRTLKSEHDSAESKVNELKTRIENLRNIVREENEKIKEAYI